MDKLFAYLNGHSRTAHFLVSMVVLISSMVYASSDVVELQPLIVTETGWPAIETRAKQSQPLKPNGELTQDLESFTGITSSRKGGKGFEPSIRGQDGSRLNTVIEGSHLQGACPATMDTATSYISRQGYDQLTVIRGHRSVIHGAGGSGGSILLARNRPIFNNSPVHGSVETAATSNSKKKSVGADMTAGGDSGYIRVYGNHDRQGNYQDGQGNNVSAAYHTTGGGAVLGYDLNDNTSLEVNYECARERDMLYAFAHPMDAPWGDSNTYRLKLEHTRQDKLLHTVAVNAWHNDVEHWMDSYSLRQRKGYESYRMPMDSKSTSTSWGTSLSGYMGIGSMDIVLGIDYQQNHSSSIHRMGGRRYLDLDHLPTISLDRPGVETHKAGVFIETDTQITASDTVRLGTRIDHITVDATKAHHPASSYMGGANPETLYHRYYVSDTDSAQETNISAVFGLVHDFQPHQQCSVFLSRSVVSADIDQRFRALSMMGEQVVGNPDIKPEVHHQLELGWRNEEALSSVELTVFYDAIENYILQYKHQQNTRRSLLYKNCDAELYGFEAGYNRQLTNNISYHSTLFYTYGQNKTEDTPLPRIAPLIANIGLNCNQGNWKSSMDWVMAAAQHRILRDFGAGFDENSDLDPEKTPGYGVINLMVQHQWTKSLLITLGVDNVFDKAYSKHLNKRANDPLNPTSTHIMEPGRECWATVRWLF